VLVLLPPSESKRDGGDGPPLDLDRLSFPPLTPARQAMVVALRDLSADPAAARAALGLSEHQDGELERNRRLTDSPTLPALRRYTGVLHDALDYPSLPPAARGRADASLVVASALFGLVRATDPVPAYRLSAGAALPGVGRLAGVGRPVLEPVLAGHGGLVVDLRSSAYAALARLRAGPRGDAPPARPVTVRVLTERADGTRIVVSHHNEATKGLVARALVSHRREPADVEGVLRALRAAGLRAEAAGPGAVDVLT
jgi:uncharacterized protein